MAVRKAEVIYVGDAASIVKASQAAAAAAAKAAAAVEDSAAKIDAANASNAASAEKVAAAEAAATKKRIATVAGAGRTMTNTLTKPILGAAAAGVYLSVKFGAAMEQIHTQAGASQAEVKKMSGAVLELGHSTEQGPVKLSQALYELESVGFRGAKALTTLKVASQLAAVGGSDLQTATSALASTMVAFQIPTHKAGETAAALNAIVGAGKMHMQDLTDAMGTKLPGVAKTLGINLKSVGAAIAVFTDQGVNATTAATNLVTPLFKMAVVTAPKSVKALASIGLGVHSLANDFRTGGISKAIDDLHNHLQGLSKNAQTDVIANAFGGSRGSAPIMQLLGVYDSATNSISARQALIERNTNKFAGDIAAEHQTASHKIKVAWSSIESSLAQAGQSLAPVVSNIASVIQKVTAAFSGMSPSARTAVVEVGLVAAALGPLAMLGARLAGPLMAVGRGIAAVATAAYTAPSIAAFGADLAAMVGPVGIAIGVVAALGAAIVILGGHESVESDLASHNAQAHRDQASAIKSVASAEIDAANKGLAAKQARLDAVDATKAATAALHKYGKGSDEYKRALLNQQVATLEATSQQKSYNDSVRGEASANVKRVTQATKDLATARKDLAAIKPPKNSVGAVAGKAGGVPNLSERDANYAKDLATAQSNLTKRTQEYVQALAKANTSDLSRQRLMDASTQITEKNAKGVSLLIQSMQALPKSVKTKLLLSGGQDALAQAGGLAFKLVSLGKSHTVAKIETTAKSAQALVEAFKAVVAGVPPRKVVSILTNANSAKSQVDALGASLRALQNRTVSVTVQNRSVQLGQHVPPQGRTKGRSVFGSNPLLFPVDAAITAAEAAQTSLQGGFDRADIRSQGRGLRAALARARHERGGTHSQAQINHIDDQIAADEKRKRNLPSGKAGTAARHALTVKIGDLRDTLRKDKQGEKKASDISNATKALKAFEKEQTRAKALGKITIQITGLEKLKAWQGALGGIADTLKGKLSEAVSAFQSKWESTVGAAFDDATQSMLDNGSTPGDAISVLNGLTSQDAAIQHTNTINANAQALQDAKATGDPRQIIAAQATIDEQTRQDAITAATTAAEAERAEIVKKRAEDRIKQYNDDATAFETALNAKLTAEQGLLSSRKVSYGAFVADVNRIFSDAGLSPDVAGLGGVTFTASSDDEAAITVGPGGVAPRSTSGVKSAFKGYSFAHPYGTGHASGGLLNYDVIQRVGELGPENIVMSSGGPRVVQASQSGGSGSGGVNFYGPVTIGNTRAVRVMANDWAYKMRHG